MSITFSRSDRLVTGLCGILGAVISVLEIGLYFIYSGPPPLDNVLVRTLVAVVAFTIYLVFATGLSRMLKVIGHGDLGLAGSVAINALLTYISITLVAVSLEAGTSIWVPDGSMDPTVDGPLSAATVLLHGPIARVLVATFLVALAQATRRTFSTRVRRGSIALAVANLLFVPSYFFGMDPAFFYAANGWGSTASIGLVNIVWLAVIGRAVLRSNAPAVTATPQAEPKVASAHAPDSSSARTR